MKPVLCSINPSLFWSTNSTGSSTDHESLEMPWFNLWEEQSPGRSGSRRAPPELLYWELVGQRKTVSASRRRERADLGWPLLREERDWQVWDKQQLQTAPCSLLGGKVLRPSLTPHPSSFYHTMSVWGPQKRTGGWVFLGWIFFIFFQGVFLLSASPMWNLPRCPHSSWAAFLHCLPFSWWWEPGSQLGCLSKP